jgi:sugar/nucleoside kinase (ribokinase family)
MNAYDVMIIGPATRDINIDYTGVEDRRVGGAVSFCAASAAATGAKVFAAVKIHPDDADIMDEIPLSECDKIILPAVRTTLMRNEYFTQDRERRQSNCLAQSDTVQLSEIPNHSCKIYHLAGLLYGDFSETLIRGLADRGKLSADAQGFLRHNVDGNMEFFDWKDKEKLLPFFSFLKVDALEAEILTGEADRVAAAKKLHAMGAHEILLSHNKEMLIFDGNAVYTCPVKARNLRGRTGRGDTFTGAYLAMRQMGDDIETTLKYATACVSLKMESVGVFRGTREDVEAYYAEFYH